MLVLFQLVIHVLYKFIFFWIPMMRRFFKAKLLKLVGLIDAKQNTASKPHVLDVTGKHHNLQSIFNDVNLQYFDNQLNLPITWFGNRNSKPKTCLTFGLYHQQSGLIKIHRLLDQAHVPIYFVAFIVYHEMLHHVLPPVKKRKRRLVHHPEFRMREKEFIHFLQAKEFKESLKSFYFK